MHSDPISIGRSIRETASKLRRSGTAYPRKQMLFSSSTISDLFGEIKCAPLLSTVTLPAGRNRPMLDREDGTEFTEMTELTGRAAGRRASETGAEIYSEFTGETAAGFWTGRTELTDGRRNWKWIYRKRASSTWFH